MCASRRRLAALLALALLVAGCEPRPRSNPLDPENPETGGGPVGFRALGGAAGVTLRWNPAPARADLLGYRLERRRYGPDAFAPLGPLLPLTSNGTADATAQWDLDYEYRLSFVDFDTTVSGQPALALARPGREVVWVSDPGADQLVRLTPDGRERVATVAGVRTVNRLAVDVGDGAVWATEPFDGRMRVFTTLGAPLSTFPGLVGPNAVAADGTTRTAWVCDEQAGDVVRYDRSGILQATAGQFDNPQDVQITAGAGAWVVDAAAGTLTRISATGGRGPVVAVGADARRAAVDALDGTVWVTRPGANEVVRVSSAGAVLARYPLAVAPFGIDIDEARNRVWVGLDGSDAVVALDRASGAEVVRVPGIARPRGVSVADRTGEVWVAAIASGQVVRLTTAGVVAGRTGGFDAPYDVRVDPGPRAEP